MSCTLAIDNEAMKYCRRDRCLAPVATRLLHCSGQTFGLKGPLSPTKRKSEVARPTTGYQLPPTLKIVWIETMEKTAVRMPSMTTAGVWNSSGFCILKYHAAQMSSSAKTNKTLPS